MDQYMDNNSDVYESDDQNSELEFMDESPSNSQTIKKYRVLKQEDIQQKQDKDIALLSSALSLPRAAACLLLHNYRWHVLDAQDAWFNDEDGVRKAVGLLKKPAVEFPDDMKQVCRICLETYIPDIRLRSCVGFCGHPYCTTCLAEGVSAAINDGPHCLFLLCPDPSCGAAIGEDMVNLLVSNDDRKKYRSYLVRSYVKAHKTTKWCPAPDCDCAIEYEIEGDNYDVFCDCSCGFCWNCGEDAHSPVDCETVATWILKNMSESENVTWLFANTKSCPNCKVPIEKNHGGMQMTCRPPCNYQFCWLCLGSWEPHGEDTGGFYWCNKYEKNPEAEEEERDKEMARIALKRYSHYYERWVAHHNSRAKAQADLLEMKAFYLEKNPQDGLEFLTKAWLQIIECRRVLKWTYAYGYYLPEGEITKKKLFEFLQGQAENVLERLHKCTENELVKYLREYGTGKYDFNGLRAKLISLTRATQNFFGNLVKALENGLSDVQREQSILAAASGCSRSFGDSDYWACNLCTYVNGANVTSCQICGINDSSGDSDCWACNFCTYLNERNVTRCQVCGANRRQKQQRLRTFGTNYKFGTNYYEGSSRSIDYPDYWVCDVCTSVNAGYVLSCHRCDDWQSRDGTANGPRLKLEAIDEMSKAVGSSRSNSEGTNQYWQSTGGPTCGPSLKLQAIKEISEASSSRSIGVDAEDSWGCELCNKLNEGQQNRCSGCGN